MNRRARRVDSHDGAPIDTGLPAAYPAAQAVLAVPVSSLSRTYGWLCLVDKVGAPAFTPHDEHLLAILGAQVGRVYENGALYRDLQKHAAQLLKEMEERERTNAQLRASEERVIKLNRVYAMLSGINSLIIRVLDRAHLLREACRLAVEQGRFRAAWCGLVKAPAGITQAAAAGKLPDEGDGGGAWNIGEHPLVAAALQAGQPVVSNDLGGADASDPLSQAMLADGCRALAALPLVVGGTAVGCLVLLSSDAGVFDEPEMVLLSEMGDDISFALDHIDKAERLNYLAYYDALTGLANRTFLQERLAQHIRGRANQQELLALIVIDIEDFDSLNDTLGRAGGDDLLRAFASRLAHCAGDAGLAARSGSDEFAAVIPHPGDAMAVTRTLESWLNQWLQAPFEIAGQKLTVGVKSGIALFPEDGTDAASLLRSAETALKTAKLTEAPYAFYTPQLGKALRERRTLESSLRRAIDEEELLLYYQPKVDFETRTLIGIEALMRWRHPEHGIVLPATFIPVMEETGLIVEAGIWALRQASADRARWLDQSLRAPRVAVNVSSAQLRREDFVRTVAATLRVAGGDAGIDIEVTESLLMQDVADNIEKLSRIRELGIGIALDDFGTGYSSLAYLAKLPVEAIKIDRSFVVAMLDDPSAMTLVSTVISLAHALRLKTVAEGVESEEQAKILRLLRCDQMQGYLISKPLPFDDMTTYLSGVRS
jgi:diguanylate cyclase (GGDEF)-like protein